MYDVIVIGTGAIGSATLYQLARRGLKVVGIDRFIPGHDRGSSHGGTRIFRQAYFEMADYVPLLKRAHQLWKELNERTGQMLYREVGILAIGPPDGEIIPGVLSSADQHRLNVEPLGSDELTQRFPGFQMPPPMKAVLEREAGFLMVEDCVIAHAQLAVEHGAELRTSESVLGWRPEGSGVVVTTDQGTLTGQHLVITAGAWAEGLLRGVGVPLDVVRKSLYWFDAPAELYSADRGTPGFVYDLPGGIFYGFPMYDELGVKVAQHTGGPHSGGIPIADPLHVDRTEDMAETARLTDFLSTYLPQVSQRQTKYSVCMYTLSPDGAFLVDLHPEYPQVSFAAGLSGHGFKFSSVLGEVLADLAQNGKTNHPIGFLSCQRPSLHHG